MNSRTASRPFSTASLLENLESRRMLSASPTSGGADDALHGHRGGHGADDRGVHVELQHKSKSASAGTLALKGVAVKTAVVAKPVVDNKGRGGHGKDDGANHDVNDVGGGHGKDDPIGHT